MQIRLTGDQSRLVWSWVLDHCVGCWKDADGHRPCENGTLCGRCHASDIKGLIKAEIQRLESELQLVQTGDSIDTNNLHLTIAQITYQNSWIEVTDDELVASHYVAFYGSDGAHHSWKSWTDGGIIIRRREPVTYRCITYPYLKTQEFDQSWDALRMLESMMQDGQFLYTWLFEQSLNSGRTWEPVELLCIQANDRIQVNGTWHEVRVCKSWKSYIQWALPKDEASNAAAQQTLMFDIDFWDMQGEHIQLSGVPGSKIDWVDRRPLAY